MVAVVKVKTVADKLANGEAKALADTLANTLEDTWLNTGRDEGQGAGGNTVAQNRKLSWNIIQHCRQGGS